MTWLLFVKAREAFPIQPASLVEVRNFWFQSILKAKTNNLRSLFLNKALVDILTISDESGRMISRNKMKKMSKYQTVVIYAALIDNVCRRSGRPCRKVGRRTCFSKGRIRRILRGNCLESMVSCFIIRRKEYEITH